MHDLSVAFKLFTAFNLWYLMGNITFFFVSKKSIIVKFQTSRYIICKKKTKKKTINHETAAYFFASNMR